MTMRRSPRRPLILKRRTLTFLQKEPSQKLQSNYVTSQDAPKATGRPQVVAVPKTEDVQTPIGALTAKGTECGVQGSNTFFILSGNNGNAIGSLWNPTPDVKKESSHTTIERINFQDAKNVTVLKPLGKDLECGRLDDSLTNIQWLGGIATRSGQANLSKPIAEKTSMSLSDRPQSCNAEPSLKQPLSERPPYSYMAMIQFAINSKQSRKMTLKEIYLWIEDHFPYFRQVAKPGWKNSIRHNLSLHNMFMRETSPDGKVSFWTIRPDANRYLTLDQTKVLKPGFDPLTVPHPSTMLFFPNQKRMHPDSNKTSFGSERKMKPLLPRTDSFFVPVQQPFSSTVYMTPASSAQLKQSVSSGAKKVRIAPKVSLNDVPVPSIKEEVAEVSIKTPSLQTVPKRPSHSSRRKQSLVHSLHEEPVLLCHNNSLFDSGVVSDCSTFHDAPDKESSSQLKQSPVQELLFKTPIKSSNNLTSSTPSKAPSDVFPEQWKVTPVGKRSQTVLDFSPIRTPGGPAVTPRHDYTTYSLGGTPFKDWQPFSSPRDLLNASMSKLLDSPRDHPRSGCSRELLQATPNNRPVTEGLALDTMNESFTKILMDISFTDLEDEDQGLADVSWSEFFPQFK